MTNIKRGTLEVGLDTGTGYERRFNRQDKRGIRGFAKRKAVCYGSLPFCTTQLADTVRSNLVVKDT